MTFHRPHSAAGSSLRARLNTLVLEDRLTPSLTIAFDYSFDSSGFFNDPNRRAVLQQAGNDLASRITTTLPAIQPSGFNSWSALFTHPVNGSQVQLPNLAVPEGAIIVFVGGTSLGGTEAGEGGPGGYTVSGSGAWQNLITHRNPTGFGTWGGSISFDGAQNWFFGLDTLGIRSNQIDFYTAATHELGHVLGIGTSNEFANLTSGANFVGAAATATNGSSVRLSNDLAHFSQGTTSNGAPDSMQPILLAGRREYFTALDYATLQDIGWSLGTISIPVTTLPIDTTATSTIPAGTPASQVTVISGPYDGAVQVFQNTNGQLIPIGSPIRPFNAFSGPVRGVASDVNGDGTADLVLVTGPTGGSVVRVLDGKTFTDLAPSFSAFEASFTGGIFVSSGDFNHDGRAEIVITPDQGGGPRVKVMSFGNGAMTVVADFFGIDDPNFRGGARSSVGDLNGDGTNDLVVAAGFGGGPRVSLIDGTSLFNPTKRNLTGDFFAFESSLTNGVYISVGDVNGDGDADLVFGAGPGGGPRVLVLDGRTVISRGAGAALASPVADFFAGSTDRRGGVRVTVKNLTGRNGIVTGSGNTNEARIYGADFNLTQAFTPFANSQAIDGVYVG